MNAQMNKLSGLAFAVSLALASGGAWAAGDTITFEDAAKVGNTGNGVNNTANIDASGGGGLNVTIRQISPETDITNRDVTANVTNMNQVGAFEGSPLTLSGTAAVKIGQGVKFDSGTPDNFDDTSEAGSVNNLVNGSISGGSVYISQTGTTAGTGFASAVNGREVSIASLSSGTLRVNQVAGDQKVEITNAMSGGTLTVNQNQVSEKVTAVSQTGGDVTVNQNGTSQLVTLTSVSAGTLNITQGGAGVNDSGQTVTITKFDGGTTNIVQGVDATNSSLTLVNDSANVTSANYATVAVNQNGAYQTTNLTYDNGGFNGTLNLNASGNATGGGVGGADPLYTSLDIKL